MAGLASSQLIRKWVGSHRWTWLSTIGKSGIGWHLRSGWDDRQNDARGTLAIVEDSLVGNDDRGGGRERLAAVEVAVELREVAARHLEPNAVAGLEQVARLPEHDPVLVGAAGLHRRW